MSSWGPDTTRLSGASRLALMNEKALRNDRDDADGFTFRSVMEKECEWLWGNNNRCLEMMYIVYSLGLTKSRV